MGEITISSGSEPSKSSEPSLSGEPSPGFMKSLNSVLREVNILLGQLDNLEGNPMLQKILQNQVGSAPSSAIGEPGASGVSKGQEGSGGLDEKMLYKSINDGIDWAMGELGEDLTLKEFKEVLENNEELIKEGLKRVLK